MELIRLNRSHKNDFKKINDITEKELENPEFFIVFFTEDEIDNILENSIKDDKTIFYGYFNEKELFSISGLFLDIEDLKYELETLNIQTNYCAEIGASMTLKSARGKKCMLNINKKLIEVAKDKGLKYIIATAHPDNIASNISLRNLNMKFIKEFSRQSFPRNLYIKYL